jgi:hypothetical protein
MIESREWIHRPARGGRLVVAATAQPRGSPIFVVVEGDDSSEAVLGWAQHQAERRHGGIRVLHGEESTTEATRAQALKEPDGLVVVGPLDTRSLVNLVFGSDACDLAGPELPVMVVPRRAWSTALPRSTPATVTVGFHGTDPATGALAWAVTEADRRNGVVRAVMAWYEGDYGGLGGPVAIAVPPSSLVGRSAHKQAADALSGCGVLTDRVSTVARRGMPASVLIEESTGSDLLAVGAGQSTVHGHRTLGAVTLACLSRSAVPVVIVPSHAGADAARNRPLIAPE